MVNHTEPSKALRFMRCTVAARTYCLPMARGRGVQRTEHLRRNPAGQRPVGWLRSGQEELPVHSLATLLPPAAPQGEPMGKIIVLHVQPRPWGLLVDQVDGVMQVRSDQVWPFPPLAQNPRATLFEAVVQHEGELLLSLCPEGLHADTPVQALTRRPMALPQDTTRMAIGMSATRGTQGKIVCFSPVETPIQGRALTFGLSISQVPQMLQFPPLVPVPGAPEYVLGLVSWRELPLVVIDLSRRLGGMASAVTPQSRLLVARAATTQAFVGFPIRSQVKMHSLPMPHRRRDDHLPLHASLLKGSFDLESEILVIPDIDSILMTSQEE